jgi:glutamate synthase (NADPH) small chain
MGINTSPVSIREVEKSIADKAFENGWVHSRHRMYRNGRRIAVIGSGPSGLSVANRLNDCGCDVVVFERADRVGGILMYGIPNERLEKRIVQRRADILAAKGINFVTNSHIGYNVDPKSIMAEFHAIVLCVGATKPRDLPIPGRQLRGVHFAMEFITANTKSLLDSNHADGQYISAKGKQVVVIGIADGWSGAILRHEPRSIVFSDLLPESRDESLNQPWPKRGTSHYAYGHEEYVACRGIDPRRFNSLAKEFVDDGKGNVGGVRFVRVSWRHESGRLTMEEVPGSEEIIPAQLVLIAKGFLGPESTLPEILNMELDVRANCRRISNVPGVFCAGDCSTGQSNIIRSIKDGLEVANLVYRYLCG